MVFVPAKNVQTRGIDPTNRGPARWERAARNALRAPYSFGGKLYRSRVALALTVSDARRAMGDTDGPWQFMGPRTTYRKDSGPRGETKRSRLYATCSTYCTVLQVTLDFGKRDLDGVAAAFRLEADANRPWMRTVEKLDVSSLKRPVTCYVCTKKIA
jgi:hypothetical protein